MVEHTPLAEITAHEEMRSSASDSLCVPYIEYSETYVSRKMPHEIPARDMAKLVIAIVNLEGPIHQEEVGRRVAKAFGLERCGSRIQESVLVGLKASSLKHDGLFWFQTGSSEKIRNRKDVVSRSLLAANNLPPMEIEQALLFLVKQNVRVSQDELIQQASRLLGFNRCGSDLRAVIVNALHNRTQKHLIENADGGYSLKS